MQVERTVYAMILMRKRQFRESRFKKISEEDATRSPTRYLYERLKSYRAIFSGTLLFRRAVKNRIIEILFYYIYIN
jgi:2-phosphoglycerate kinase